MELGTLNSVKTRSTITHFVLQRGSMLDAIDRLNDDEFSMMRIPHDLYFTSEQISHEWEDYWVLPCEDIAMTYLIMPDLIDEVPSPTAEA
jgi:hypothetical protein